MDDTRYKSIRGERDFLFRYFTLETNFNTPPQSFDQLLGVWLTAFVGVHPQQGIQTIISFLDKKHNFNVS